LPVINLALIVCPLLVVVKSPLTLVNLMPAGTPVLPAFGKPVCGGGVVVGGGVGGGGVDVGVVLATQLASADVLSGIWMDSEAPEQDSAAVPPAFSFTAVPAATAGRSAASRIQR